MLTSPEFHPTRSKYLVITADYIIPFFIIIFGISLIYFLLFSRYFQITSISCSLDFATCQDAAVLSELDRLKGQNIFRLTKDKLSAKLTSGDFTISQVEMVKNLPSSLQISLLSVHPVSAISVKNHSTWIVLDQKYRVIAERSVDPNVPTVMILEPLTLTLGKPIADPKLIATLNLALRLAQELVSVKTLTLIDDNTVEISLTSGQTALFSPRLDETTQLKTLQSILADATILKGVSTIDVRFNRPVLR